MNDDLFEDIQEKDNILLNKDPEIADVLKQLDEFGSEESEQYDDSLDFPVERKRSRKEEDIENKLYKIYDLDIKDIQPIDYSFITQFKGEFAKCLPHTEDTEYRLPHFCKLFDFFESVIKIKSQEKVSIIEYEREDFVAFLEYARKIYFNFPKICFKFPRTVRTQLQKEQFKPPVYRKFVLQCLDVAIEMTKDLEDSDDNKDIYRPLIRNLLGLAAVLNSLDMVTKILLVKVKSVSFPPLFKSILYQVYELKDKIELGNGSQIKVNREIIIFERVIVENYKLDKIVRAEKDTCPLDYLKRFTELTQVLWTHCRTINWRLGGHNLKQTLCVIDILKKTILRGFVALCELIEQRMISTEERFDYANHIKEAVEMLKRLKKEFYERFVKIKDEFSNSDQDEVDETIKVGDQEVKQAKEEEEESKIDASMIIDGDQIVFGEMNIKQGGEEGYYERLKIKEKHYNEIKKLILRKQDDIEEDFNYIFDVLGNEQQENERDPSLAYSHINQSQVSQVAGDNENLNQSMSSEVVSLNESQMFRMEQRLIADSQKINGNEDKERLVLHLMRANINYSELADYMRMVYEQFIKLYEQKDRKLESQKEYHTKIELSKRFHCFFINCLRLVRAGNFCDDLIEQIAIYYQFLFENPNVPAKKLLKLKTAFSICLEKLDYKFANDENLKSSETFANDLGKFRQVYSIAISKVNEYFGVRAQQNLIMNEERRLIKKACNDFEESTICKKLLKRLINTVHYNFNIYIQKRHFTEIFDRIKDELKMRFSIYTDKDISVQGYGLTGCGIIFLNSTIKTLVRLNNAVQKTKPLFTELSKHNFEGDQPFKLINESWFEVVAFKDPQSIYLRLVKGPSENYNGIVFKVKFDHKNCRRKNKLSLLLKNYIYFDKEKVKRLAYFWIFFLKVNCLIGEKNGYPSGTSYLMMLINYLQQQYILPNLQARRDGDDVQYQDCEIDERLTVDEILSLKSRLTQQNVDDLNKGQLQNGQLQQQKTILVHYYFNGAELSETLRSELNLARAHIRRKGKQSTDSLLIRFFKFLVFKLPERSVIFDIYKGRPLPKRIVSGHMQISVKSPFIRGLNETKAFTDRNKLNKLVFKLKEFINAASTANCEKYFMNVEQQQE